MQYTDNRSHLKCVRFFIIALLLTVLFLAEASHRPVALAAGKPSFALQPVLYDPGQPATRSYFIFNVHPATTLYNRVRVTNSGTATGTLHLYSVDATTGQTSGIVYFSPGSTLKDVGAWITLGIQSLTLAPGQSKIVPFIVTIPRAARPGQHVGGIVAENEAIETQGSTGSSFQVHVQNLTIVAVQLNLSGTPVEQLIATDIQPEQESSHPYLLVGLDNTGTMMLKPSGCLQITGAQGRLLQNIPLNLDTLLPRTYIQYPVYFKNIVLGNGNYEATLKLLYGSHHILYYTQAFAIRQQSPTKGIQPFTSSPQLTGPENTFLSSMPPWLIVLCALLLVSGLLFWCQQLYRLTTRTQNRARGKK